MDGKKEIAVFGGGCFWCTEAIFSELRGVISVTSGYAGGDTGRPTYEQVSSGTTGHAEVIRVEFDPAQIRYADLLAVFFATHDPTSMDRQGNDTGPEYRSMVLYTNEEQQRQTAAFVQTWEKEHPGKQVVTDVQPFGIFYEAEGYHQQYYAKNASEPYCQIVIDPKLAKLRAKFGRMLKTPV